MALFPAYGEQTPIEKDADSDSIKETTESSQDMTDLENEDILIGNINDHKLEPFDENVLLMSDSSPASEDSKKSKKRKKKASKKKSKKAKQDNAKEEDFYTDCKIDYGNLRVSTLYNPARPYYDHIKKTLGHIYMARSKKPTDRRRYYNMKIMPYIEEIREKSPKTSKGRSKRPQIDFITIVDSGAPWDDMTVEKDLLDKTAKFNKHVNNHPYDVDKWLEYVKFQEDRKVFDVCNNRVTSEMTAKNLCYSKQLSILDAALKVNFDSMELLSKKVELSEQSMPNDQYLAMLKQLVSTPDMKRPLLIRSWFWYIDSVQCSMALSSVPSVKEMYAAAIKALHKALGPMYQVSHVDIVYRLGLYLRQSGLWEQLWMLMKMNIDMNLAASRGCQTFDFNAILPKVDEKSLMAEENKLISSGLPLSTIWCRIEALRSASHWLPSSNDEADDPQRIVFSTDLADFIKPVTNRADTFSLIVNLIRLLKVPILPMRQALVDMLSSAVIDWEFDSADSLPLLFTLIDGLRAIDPLQVRVISKVMREFSESPNIFNASGDYFNFVSAMMVQCSKLFDGDEKTALLIWWIRFQRVVIAALSTKDNSQKPVASHVRKAVKEVLKSERENVTLYAEFSALESQLCGADRGCAVLETSLRAISIQHSPSRVYLARSFTELLLRRDNEGSENIMRAINVLVSLACNKPLPKDLLTPCSDQTIDDSLTEFSGRTDTFLLAATNFDREMSLVELMVPDVTVDWICCHGWLIYLTQSHNVLKKFYQKILNATFVKKDDRKQFDSKRQSWIKENLFEWFTAVMNSNIRIVTSSRNIKDPLSEQNVLELSLEEFSSNSVIVWHCVEAWAKSGPMGRWRLINILNQTDRPSHLLAVGFLLHDFVHLHRSFELGYEESWQPGHANRLLNLLQTLTRHPSLKRSVLIWQMYLTFVSHYTQQPIESAKKVLYQALDECPWNKSLYRKGCVNIPSEYAELIDLMVEKQIRLHTMPEELEPL